MKMILERYKPLWIGALVVAVLTFVLERIGFLLIDPKEIGTNTAILGFWWLLLSYLIYRFEQAKNKLGLLGRLGGVLLLLAAIILVEPQSNTRDNPLSLVLMVAFWLYLASWLLPRFFRKYQALIVGLYVVILLAFSYVRLFQENFEEYREELILAFLWPVPFLVVLWIYDQWKWLKALQADKSQAELALLKSQINPHFFFNTLNNLHALTINQSSEAPAVIVKLSDMMRYTIYEGKKDWVPIEEEVAYLQNYIELHEIRQHEKVSITFEQDVERGAMVSPLLFIVLLENAFKHGAEKLVTAAYINISLSAKAERIVFSIENNYDAEEVNEEKGIGLENLRRRLDLVYPDQYSLEIVQEESVYKVDLVIEKEY